MKSSGETVTTLKVMVQNLQKKGGLATKLVKEHKPDLFLAQEINLASEEEELFSPAHNTSRLSGYGTAIYSRGGVVSGSVRKVQSPYAETGGFIYKKTTIATVSLPSSDTVSGQAPVTLECVTFHGYNGQPFKNVSKLVAHVEVVLSKLSPDTSQPAIFAGDFNTWTTEHLDAVRDSLQRAGFHLVFSWPYPGKDFQLDHAFVRGGIQLESKSVYPSEADHLGAILGLSLKTR